MPQKLTTQPQNNLWVFLFPTNAACCRPQRQKGHPVILSLNSVGNTVWGTVGATSVPLFQQLPHTQPLQLRSSVFSEPCILFAFSTDAAKQQTLYRLGMEQKI